MKKSLVCALVFFVAGPGIAAAQVYYPNSYSYSYVYTNPYSPYTYGCVSIASDLSYGSRGSEVSTLQQFLVNQHYPGDGSWMVTGYFGRATEQAVRNFQASRGLLVTGVVDWQTQSAVSQVSCGGSGYVGNAYGYPSYSYPSQTYPYSYQYPYSYPYGAYGYSVPLRLDSLSSQSGFSGSSLTLYGSGFDNISNTVRFGNNAAAGAGSTNGTSLMVTVPNLPPGVYGVYITNGRGTSNSLAFTVTGNSYGYYNYGYNYNYPYSYNYPYNYGCSSYLYPYGCY